MRGDLYKCFCCGEKSNEGSFFKVNKGEKGKFLCSNCLKEMANKEASVCNE